VRPFQASIASKFTLQLKGAGAGGLGRKIVQQTTCKPSCSETRRRRCGGLDSRPLSAPAPHGGPHLWAGPWPGNRKRFTRGSDYSTGSTVST